MLTRFLYQALPIRGNYRTTLNYIRVHAYTIHLQIFLPTTAAT